MSRRGRGSIALLACLSAMHHGCRRKQPIGGPPEAHGARACVQVRLVAHVTWDKRLLKNSKPDLGFRIEPEGAKGRTVEGPIALVEKEQWVTGPSENGVKLDLVFSCGPGRYEVSAGVFGPELLLTGKVVIGVLPDGAVEPEAIRLVLKRR